MSCPNNPQKLDITNFTGRRIFYNDFNVIVNNTLLTTSSQATSRHEQYDIKDATYVHTF